MISQWLKSIASRSTVQSRHHQNGLSKCQKMDPDSLQVVDLLVDSAMITEAFHNQVQLPAMQLPMTGKTKRWKYVYVKCTFPFPTEPIPLYPL